jgi:hypothetical protein
MLPIKPWPSLKLLLLRCGAFTVQRLHDTMQTTLGTLTFQQETATRPIYFGSDALMRHSATKSY